MNQNNHNPIVIVGHARTPIGELLGGLSSLSAPQLGSIVIEEALNRAHINPANLPENATETIMGCVLSAGLGQAPARQAAIFAGIPQYIGATTINKMCASGMKAMMMACDSLHAKTNQIVIAGGMESMSNAPYLLPKIRSGYRMGHKQILDSIFIDGLEDVYEKLNQKNALMGAFADQCAKQYGLTREIQDSFALASLLKAQHAIEMGYFKSEIVPVKLMLKKNNISIFDTDELPSKARPENIPLLKPAFSKDGTVTAANSSGISDGAAAHILMHYDKAKDMGIAPIAKIVGYVTHAQEPSQFTTAPIGAIKKLLQAINWTLLDVDLFEINEAFACVALVTIKELNLDINKVNIHGGACALGHPIGASGARIMSTLIEALKQNGLKRGIATLCIGGGEATAMAIELI